METCGLLGWVVVQGFCFKVVVQMGMMMWFFSLVIFLSLAVGWLVEFGRFYFFGFMAS